MACGHKSGVAREKQNQVKQSANRNQIRISRDERRNSRKKKREKQIMRKVLIICHYLCYAEASFQKLVKRLMQIKYIKTHRFTFFFLSFFGIFPQLLHESPAGLAKCIRKKKSFLFLWNNVRAMDIDRGIIFLHTRSFAEQESIERFAIAFVIHTPLSFRNEHNNRPKRFTPK